MMAVPIGALLPAKLSLLFADASMDPTGGDWDALIVSFLHNLHNGSTNTTTEDLRDMVIASGARNKLLSLTVVSGNRARLYTLCTKW